MGIDKLRITAHSFRRMAQRNITLSDVLTALKYGRRIHRAHAEFWFLGRRDCPKGQERLEGLTLVVERASLSTAYRNKRAIGKVRRKRKRYHGCMEDRPVGARMMTSHATVAASA